MKLIELLAKGEVVRFDDSLNPVSGIDEKRLVAVPPILGVEDKKLEVPAIGKEVVIPGRYRGWTIRQCPKQLADEGNGDEDFVFRIRGGGIERIVCINDVFTNKHERDYSQHVTGLAYLGIGGLALLTSEQELRCLFGPTLEHDAFFDLGYWSTENIRLGSGYEALDRIKSFTACGRRYALVDDLDYCFIHNTDSYPPEAQGKLTPSSYPLLAVCDRGVRTIGHIKQVAEWERKNGTHSFKSTFDKIIPFEMAGTALLLHTDDAATDLYRIEDAGKSGSLVKVSSMPPAEAGRIVELR